MPFGRFTLKKLKERTSRWLKLGRVTWQERSFSCVLGLLNSLSLTYHTSQAGLFSATVTAFIIEGYRNLQPDPKDLAVSILTHISLQLAATNGSLAVPPFTGSSVPFQAPVHAVRSNILFLLSLAFSLAGALAAILVQQWATNYLHGTQSRPSPRVRAGIRAFLRGGVIDFHFPSLVEAIPALLHISLFLFFGGLFEFMNPINSVLGTLTLAVLVVCAGLYAFASFLATFSRRCPYQTTLSSIFWYTLRLISVLYQGIINRTYTTVDTPKDEMEVQATAGRVWKTGSTFTFSDWIIPRAEKRAADALQWTIECLTDDDEFEPFVAGICGLLASDGYADGFKIACQVYSFELDNRILGFLISSARLPPAREERRVFVTLSALWSLTSASLERDALLLECQIPLEQGESCPWSCRQEFWLRFICDYIHHDNLQVARMARYLVVLLCFGWYRYVLKKPEDNRVKLHRHLENVREAEGYTIPGVRSLGLLLEGLRDRDSFSINIRLASFIMLLAVQLDDPPFPDYALQGHSNGIVSTLTLDLSCAGCHPSLQQWLVQTMGAALHELELERPDRRPGWRMLEELIPLLETIDNVTALEHILELIEDPDKQQEANSCAFYAGARVASRKALQRINDKARTASVKDDFQSPGTDSSIYFDRAFDRGRVAKRDQSHTEHTVSIEKREAGSTGNSGGSVLQLDSMGVGQVDTTTTEHLVDELKDVPQHPQADRNHDRRTTETVQTPGGSRSDVEDSKDVDEARHTNPEVLDAVEKGEFRRTG